MNNIFKSDCPNTIDELVECLSNTHDESTVRLFVEKIRATDFYRDYNIPAIWNLILDFEFLYKDEKGAGWVTREGKVLTCNYAAHERLLTCLGIETHDAEQAGWARMGPFMWQCLYRLTTRQKRVIEANGHIVLMENERLKPTWSGVPIVGF